MRRLIVLFLALLVWPASADVSFSTSGAPMALANNPWIPYAGNPLYDNVSSGAKPVSISLGTNSTASLSITTGASPVTVALSSANPYAIVPQLGAYSIHVTMPSVTWGSASGTSVGTFQLLEDAGAGASVVQTCSAVSATSKGACSFDYYKDAPSNSTTYTYSLRITATTNDGLVNENSNTIKLYVFLSAKTQRASNITTSPVGFDTTRCDPICIWNDPDVHKHNAGGFACPGGPAFCAYVGLGTKGSGDSVTIEYLVATNAEGPWTWNATVLDKTQDTVYGVETPSVIDTGVVGAQRYRMCYTVYDAPPGTTYYTMYCGYSANGLTGWTTAEVTSITNVVQAAGNPWGTFAVAEPSLRYNATTGKIELAYVQARCRVSDCSGFPVADRRIELAVSNFDWTAGAGISAAFTDTATLLTQQPVHDSRVGWDGYSTPNRYCGPSLCLLVVSLFREDGEGFHQRAIALFRSTDGATGRAFRVDQPVLISTTVGQPWWTNNEIRSGSIFVIDASTLGIMFAANNPFLTSGDGPPTLLGIGLLRASAALYSGIQ